MKDVIHMSGTCVPWLSPPTLTQNELGCRDSFISHSLHLLNPANWRASASKTSFVFHLSGHSFVFCMVFTCQWTMQEKMHLKALFSIFIF